MKSPLSMSERFVILFFALALCSLVLGFWEYSRKEVVSRDQSVTVINQWPVENDDRLFFFGDECFLRRRGDVVRRFSPREVVLMEYHAPKGTPVSKQSCPSGTLFLGALQD